MNSSGKRPFKASAMPAGTTLAGPPRLATAPSRIPAMSTSKPPSPTGETHSATEGERSPRLPHERDESSDSGQSEPRDVIRQAHDDIESGKRETDRGEVTDEVYRKTLKDPGKA